MSYTITHVWKAKWYKWPLLWWTGKPTTVITIYAKARLTDMTYSVDSRGILTMETEFTQDDRI